jgi:hypothetical protein
MIDDPCSGHFCDGCATCRSGVCCLTSSSSAATTDQTVGSLDALRTAFAESPNLLPRLTTLLLGETQRKRVEDLIHLVEDAPERTSEAADDSLDRNPSALPPPAVDLLDHLTPTNQQKEARKHL